MAKLNGPFSFDGPLGGLSAYQRIDVEGTILRSRSSVDRERIYSDPAFENTLRNATEGGGRSKAAKLLRRVLHPLEPVRVGNWQAPLTKALTPVQYLDTQGVYGQRRVLFSRHGRLLEGLCLSRRIPFEGLVRNPVTCTLSRESLQAELTFPEMSAGVNFFAPASQPYFRLAAVLGVVPDLLYTEQGYQPDGDFSQVFPVEAFSNWYATKSGTPATTFALKLPQQPSNDSYGLLLAVGILMGSVNQGGQIEPVKYQGSGRIMVVR